MIGTLATAALVLVGLTAVLSAALSAAARRFAVAVDPREAAARAVLPGANCGGCGHPSCAAYARAAAAGSAGPDRCTVGGPPVARALAEALGVEPVEAWPVRPVVRCGARTEDRLGRGEYAGRADCAAADVVAGVQSCADGCLGLGDCVRACEVGAIALEDGLPRIDLSTCTGCGACTRACPRRILAMVPFRQERIPVVACANRDPGRAVRGVCRAGCIGCERCARLRPDLFAVGDGDLAAVDPSHDPGVEGLEEVRAVCPTGAIRVVGPLPPAVGQRR